LVCGGVGKLAPLCVSGFSDIEFVRGTLFEDVTGKFDIDWRFLASHAR